MYAVSRTDSEAEEDSHVAVPSNNVKPKALSWAWWALLFSALAVWKFTPKEWAIWNLSSYASYATVYGLLNPAFDWINTNLPWLIPGIKAAASKVAAIAVAGWEVMTP